MQTAELLIKLSNMNIMSGIERESELLNIATEFLSLPKENFSYDNLGNLYIKLNEKGKKHIMLEAHTDETGLIVTDITENGFLKIASVGGMYTSSILGNLFTVLGEKELPAVAVTVPPHLSSGDNTLPEIRDILLDIGYGRQEAESMVKVGDRVCRRRSAEALNEYRVTGKALDNRAGVAVLLLSAKKILEHETQNRITLAFTSQEEVGCRGASVTANNICPDEAICVDVSFATQTGVNGDEAGELSKGPMLGISPILSRRMLLTLRDICEKVGLPCQTEVMAGKTGTDADVIQISNGGVPCALISIPQRNMHSSSEIIDIRDIENSAKLIATYCEA